MKLKRKLEILVVDDNPADIRLTQEVFRDLQGSVHLHVAHDGENALEFLHRKHPFEQVPRPDLILLDLNMPRKDGREVLMDIKKDSDLRSIPVVVLTTSGAEKDVTESYGLHANCYITKPMNLPQFIKVVESIQNFWLNTAVLPRVALEG